MTQHARSSAFPGRRWWRDPVVWGFAVLAVATFSVSAIENEEWLSGLLFWVGLAGGSLVAILMTRSRHVALEPLDLPSRETWPMLAWYVVFVGLSLALPENGLLSGEFTKWLWFIVLPLALLYVIRGWRRGPGDTLRSIGVRRQGLGRALLTALVSFAVVGVFLPFFIPADQAQRLLDLARQPLNLLVAVPLAFLLSLITAATTEEVFFRGILQSRLAIMFRSDLRACLVVALMFGLYHLPYAYFMDSWPTHGNLLWAISSVIGEQALAGVVLGLLWWRTRNLAAPILFHALVNMVGILSNFHFGQ